MISKNKPQKGRIGTAYHVEKACKHKKVNCQHYDQEDGSCYAKSVILWQIGYDICDKCKQKMPLDDEEYDTSKVKKTKKNKKTWLTPSFFIPFQTLHSLVYLEEREKARFQQLLALTMVERHPRMVVH